MVGHVAGRIDVGRAGPAQRVGQDAVILRDRGTGHNPGLGGDPDADDREVTRDPLPAAGDDCLQARPAIERGDLLAGQQFDAVARWKPAMSVPISAPSTLASGTWPGKSTVTWTPSWASDAATSQPMKPMPTTTARRPATASALIASHSATVRR